MFYCHHVKHHQSVIAQQSEAINWMRICIKSILFTWSDYATVHHWRQEVLPLPHIMRCLSNAKTCTTDLFLFLVEVQLPVQIHVCKMKCERMRKQCGSPFLGAVLSHKRLHFSVFNYSVSHLSLPDSRRVPIWNSGHCIPVVSDC